MTQISYLDFNLLLKSLTVSQIKEIIDDYNQQIINGDSKAKKLKGYSGLKKDELIEFVDSSLSEKDKSYFYEIFEPEISKKLISDALLLIVGEHKTERIQNAGILSGGKGYRIWYTGKYGSHKALVEVLKDVNRMNCNCKIGKFGGICLHQMAIFLMLYSKNAIKLEDFPFKVDHSQFKSIKKRLELLATQSLFKEEPSIILSNDYKIYVNGDLVTYEWAGDFAGKRTRDMSEEEEDVDTWISNKIVEVMLKHIKVKTKEGKSEKIILDNYGIIPKIIENPKLVKKILTKFKKLEDPELPTEESQLEAFLKKNLKESSIEMDIDPPFNAYEGEEAFLFVSYTHKDKSKVYPIIKKLYDKGINIWYDEGIPLSTDWCNTLAEKIMDSKIFLSFISNHVPESENTQDEIQFAINEGKTFLAIYLTDSGLTPGLKMRMRRIQGIQKFEMEEKRFYNKLLNEINRLL